MPDASTPSPTRPDVNLIAAALRDLARLIADGTVDQQLVGYAPAELRQQAETLEREDAWMVESGRAPPGPNED